MRAHGFVTVTLFTNIFVVNSQVTIALFRNLVLGAKGLGSEKGENHAV